MKSERILRLFLKADWPAAGSSCAWALLGRDRSLLERGVSDARHWPAADECEAIVSADQASWLAVSLPEKLGRDGSRIIAYALEDKLIEAPDAMHIVLRRTADPGATSAIVVRRTRVKEIVDAVTSTGRRLDRMFLETQLVRPPANVWSLCRFGETAFLRTAENQGLAVDWPESVLPPVLSFAVDSARSRGELPVRLEIHAPVEPSFDPQLWSSALGIPVVVAGRFDPLAAAISGANNLLTDQFAPPGRMGFADRAWRLSAVALLVAALGHTLASLADWAIQARRAAELRAEAVAIYREAVPGSTAPLLDPGLQLQREAAALLRGRGKAGADDLLTMLDAVTRELPAATRLRRLHYERSSLELSAVLPGAAVSGLDDALRPRGYRAETTVGRQEAAGTEYKILVRLK